MPWYLSKQFPEMSGGEVVARVTSIVRDRGRAFVVVTAVATSAALLSAPVAFGAGDPVAIGTVKFKLSKGFKKQLKRNGVKMAPNKGKFKVKAKGSQLDPTTGVGVLSVGKITFKGHGKKLVFGNVKVNLKANKSKSSVTGKAAGNTGKIFSLKGGTITRNGFGATLSGVKMKFFGGAAKKINKKLELDSLHAGKAGTLSASEQPKTVGVTGGFVFVNIPSSYLPASPLIPGSGADPNTVAAKQPSHCISPVGGVHVIPGDPSNPARLTTSLSPDPVLGPPPSGVSARFRFPVTGGTVSPTGAAGSFTVVGGVRLETGTVGLDAIFVTPQPGNCAGETPGETTSHTFLNTTSLSPNLALQNVQSNVFIGGTTPGCNWDSGNPTCGVPAVGGPGDKGVAIGQVLDSAAATVTADPVAKSVTIAGAVIKNNALTAGTLQQVFPNAGPAAQEWADGDKFGISIADLTTR